MVNGPRLRKGAGRGGLEGPHERDIRVGDRGASDGNAGSRGVAAPGRVRGADRHGEMRRCDPFDPPGLGSFIEQTKGWDSLRGPAAKRQFKGAPGRAWRVGPLWVRARIPRTGGLRTRGIVVVVLDGRSAVQGFTASTILPRWSPLSMSAWAREASCSGNRAPMWGSSRP